MEASELAFARHARAVRLCLLAFLAALCLPFAALAHPAAGANQSGENHIKAELVAEGAAIPGETLSLALVFRPDPGWHGYWENPGDAGYGMRLDWDLPEGWRAGEPQYPVPEQLLIAGLMNHVYEGDYAVLVPLEVPADESRAQAARIAVTADWLACTDQICVPESGSFALNLAAGTNAPLDSGPESGQDATRDERFDLWRAGIPPLLDSEARVAFTPDTVRIGIPVPASLEIAAPHVFIAEDGIADYAALQTFRREGDLLVAEIARRTLAGAEDPAQVSGILAFGAAGEGLRFVASPGAVPAGGAIVFAGAGSAAGEIAPLWVLLGGALLGGLILNLMPCVFPILSLKALTLARAGARADGSEAQARREGLAYTAGVVLTCVALGGLLLLLRAGGSQIGWAFQLQEPGVVVALLVLAIAITANFAGLFELPSFSITRAGGQNSAFATGLLAAFVATPCTGPFMAAALGAALLLPWGAALLLFAVLGLGLALPFLLLGFVPPLRRLLPAPGAWMERFRRLMAIPMGLTALALAWLCWRLGGAGFLALALVVAALAVLVLMALQAGRGGRALAGAALAGGLAALALPVVFTSAPAEDGAAGLLEPTVFSQQALADARTSGRPVFLWFTADWCLTCKVNESVAIEREATREAFAQGGVIAMRGDWTRRDPQITRFLTEHGVAGVPLYLWYPAGGEGEILPQVLTPGSLVERAKTGAVHSAPSGGDGLAAPGQKLAVRE